MDTHFIDVYDYTATNRGTGGSISAKRSYRANVNFNFNSGSYNASSGGELEKVDAAIVISLSADVSVGNSIDIDSTFYEATKVEKLKSSIGGPITHTEVKVKIDQRGTV